MALDPVLPPEHENKWYEFYIFWDGTPTHKANKQTNQTNKKNKQTNKQTNKQKK